MNLWERIKRAFKEAFAPVPAYYGLVGPDEEPESWEPECDWVADDEFDRWARLEAPSEYAEDAALGELYGLYVTGDVPDYMQHDVDLFLGGGDIDE